MSDNSKNIKIHIFCNMLYRNKDILDCIKFNKIYWLGLPFLEFNKIIEKSIIFLFHFKV